MRGDLPLFHQGPQNISAPGFLEATGYIWKTQPRGEELAWFIQILLEARDVLGWGWAYFCRSCQKGVLYPSSEAKAPLGLEAAA